MKLRKIAAAALAMSIAAFAADATEDEIREWLKGITF